MQALAGNIVWHSETSTLLQAFVPSSEWFVSLYSAMAKVTQQIFIEYRGGPKIQWPESMVETLDDGSKWMRRRRSNYSLCKLELGHHEKFKKLKHASFSAGVKWKELLEMQKNW